MIFKPLNIITLLLACLYIYGGSGFYLANFCCDNCRGNGIGVFLSEGCHQEENQNSCCNNKIHQESEEILDLNICKQHCPEENHCKIISYKLDLNDTFYKHKYQIPESDLIHLLVSNPELKYFEPNKTLKNLPLLITSSRDILSFNTVLRI